MHEAVEADVLSLVWSAPLAAFIGVRESLNCAQSCGKLRQACQEPSVWRQLAFLLHYIRPVQPQTVDTKVDLSLDWLLFVKLNAPCRSCVTVRLGCHDLRLPLYSFREALSGIKALYYLLSKVLAVKTPFRLRWLQWGGRPGRLLDRHSVSSLLNGSRLLLEWGDEARGWALPPYIFHTGLHLYLDEFRSQSVTKGYLLRVVSSLLPEEHWIQVPVTSDVWHLVEMLCILFRHHSSLASTSRPLHFHLADLPSLEEAEGPMLWDLAWADCETIYAELAQEESKTSDGILVVDVRREAQLGEKLRDAAAGTTVEAVEQSPARLSRPKAKAAKEERIVPHSPPMLLPGTQKCRQFEFHPSQSDVLLIGDTDGTAKIVQTGVEAILSGPVTQVDRCALLGLSWFRHSPDLAVCGASCSGKIQFLRYFPDSRQGPTLSFAGSAREKFPKLSSLSVNCSDNFLLASGISCSVCVFDIESGAVLSRASGVHEHFINISRFCNTCPHIFATASFDHSCKIWDLRRPLRSPVKMLRTDGHNVMCTFSPDDRFFLSSGVDTRLTQFEVGTWEPRPMPLRPAVHTQRYRRSAYMANSKRIVTGSTEESHIHLLSVTGQNLGCLDLRHFQELNSKADLIRGTVVLDDSQHPPGPRTAFVQSIRTHPVLTNRVGVLMASEGIESHIAMIDLEPKETGP